MRSGDVAAPNASASAIYASAREVLCEHAIWTRKTARKLDERIRILHPKWEPKPGEGPIDQWQKEWIHSGFFEQAGGGRLLCMLPANGTQVRGAAVSAGGTRVGTHLSVSSQAGRARVHMRLVVGACPPQRVERSQRTRLDWTAYTDGGCKDEQAGWGYVLTEEGDGVED